MLLRKKKSKSEVLAERASEIWESASQSVAGTVGPRLDDARVAAAPVLADAQERAVVATELSRRKAKKAKKRAAALAAVAATAAAAKAEEHAHDDEQPKKKEKKHRLRKLVLFAAISGAIAFAVKKLTSAPSGGSYTPPPPPPEPVRPTGPATVPASPAAAQPPEGQDADALAGADVDPLDDQRPGSDKI